MILNIQLVKLTSLLNINKDIWDTAGQEIFNTLHSSYYFGAHAALLVFDTTRKVTYKHSMEWYKEFRSFCPSVPCLLVGNKIDRIIYIMF